MIVIWYQTLRETMHEVHGDVVPVGSIPDHDITKDFKVYPVQVAVKSFISIPGVESEGISCLVKYGVL